MTEIISLKNRVNISKEHVTKALVDINPEGVSIRKKKTMKQMTHLMCCILMEMIN